MAELINYVNAYIYYYLPDNTTQSVIREGGVCEHYEESGYYKYTLTEEDVAEIEVLGYNFVNWNSDLQMTQKVSAGQTMTMNTNEFHLYGTYTPFTVNDYMSAIADEARLFFGTEDKLSLKGVLEKTKEMNKFTNALLEGFSNNSDVNIKSYTNNNLTYIAYGRFSYNKSIETINLPNCTRIEENGFARCDNLKSVFLPKVKSIGKDSFLYCSSLQSIELPLCTSMGYRAFYDTSLKSIYAPKITSIADQGFQGTQLTTINLPETEYIGELAFSGVSSLQTINIPKVTAIHKHAFNVTSLTNLIAEECTDIYAGAFKDCSKLTSVSLPKCRSLGTDAVYDTDIGEAHGAFTNCSNLNSVELPLVTHIYPQAFSRCTSLTDITLPVCHTIDDGAFEYCTNLNSVIFTSSYNLGGYIFKGCSSLTSLYLANENSMSWQNRPGGGSPLAGSPYDDKDNIGKIFIYVPKKYLDRYKTHDQWKDYADFFVAIPEYDANVTFTFTINGISYPAYGNMTWASWMESDLNTIGVYENTSINFIKNSNNENLTYDSNGTQFVNPADKIQKDYNYYWVPADDREPS